MLRHDHFPVEEGCPHRPGKRSVLRRLAINCEVHELLAGRKSPNDTPGNVSFKPVGAAVNDAALGNGETESV